MKKTFTSQSGAVNRLKHYYGLATAEELNNGLKWYGKAHEFARALSLIHNIPLIQVCGIIAALSPQQAWDSNLKQAKQFLNNRTATGATAARIEKCFSILDTQDETEILEILSKGAKFLKTRKFFINIYAPERTNDVTIDRHAIAAMQQNNNNVAAMDEQSRQLTPKQYLFAESCYISAANKLNITPCQLQGIVWIVYRRLRALNEHKQVNPF